MTRIGAKPSTVSSPARKQAPTRGAGTSRWFASVWDSPLTSYYMVVGSSAMLIVFGLVMVLSSSSIEALADGESVFAEFLKQGMYVVVGLALMLVASRIPIAAYMRLTGVILVASFLMQMLIFTPLARGKGGNTNWVHIAGPVTIQPSEFIKIALALWLGFVMYHKRDQLNDVRAAIFPAVPVIFLALLLVVAGNDLGTAGILMLLAAGALFVAGIPLRVFVVAATGFATFAVAYVLVASNRISRIKAWLGHDDVSDPQGLNYQTKHGLWGLGSGGITGVGLGASRQKWSYLPEAHNDFIFAIIGEELGLLGTVAVLLLFAALGLGMIRIIRRHDNMMARVTTAAIACWIIGQALINIGVVIGFLPVIGVPLPLISSGGSALISTMLALGVVIQFARTEPGAAELLRTRPSVVRKSVSVIAHSVRTGLPTRSNKKGRS
ncbi:putative lipid II flippase FtsW [Rarobacter incanus]|uniref:Probable peptidoglycan glycosyltransferase FtsW n=1 Tax=Rarobacter incanus TaxID=153494 RepID=A0A542SLJ0_9MICO|nr:putative lipid II flippase FtsW [Rarobacter incanus]TQK75496.1 cell division-specific peptidoglycan biosynthesis regulator FtsW [Rarobacter incanus]